MKFSVRIAVYVVVLFLIASVGFFNLANRLLDKSVKGFLDDSLKTENQQVIDMIKVAGQTSVAQHLRTISEQDLGMIQSCYREYLSGAITEDEAKKKAIKSLAAQTIGKTGYIYVVNSVGNVIYHPNAGVNGSDLSKYEFIQQQIKNKTGFVTYKWKNPGDVEEKEKVLYMSYFDKWDWIVSFSTYKSEFDRLIDISDFQNEISRIVIGKTGYVSVINSKGDFIIHPFYQGKNVATLDQHSQDIIREIIAKKNGTLRYEWKNSWESQSRPKTAAFSYVEAYDWYVVSTYYEDELYGPFQKLMNLFLTFVMLGALIMMVFIVVLVKQQSKPLERIVLALKEGVAGDLSIRLPVPINKKDEFSVLSGYFNDFMENLEHTQERLENEVYIRKQNEDRLQSLLETTTEGYVQMTSGSYITDVNDTFCKILDTTKEEILGKELGQVLEGSAKTAFDHHMMFVGQGEAVRFEMKMAMADQSEKHFMVNASPILNSEGSVAGSFALLTDITELKKVLQDRESLIEKYQELNNNLEGKIEERTHEMTTYVERLKVTKEELVRSEKLSSLGLMISGIANELNSPLGNGITMSSFIEAQSKDVQAKKEAGKLGEEECGEYIQNVKAASIMILDNLSKASLVLNSLKHIYPEQIKGMKESFNLSESIAGVQETFKKELVMGAHTVVVICDPKLVLHSYPKLLKQMLMNLVSNSLLHGFKSGYPGNINIKVREVEDQLHIEYSDDGEGMPYQARDKVFEPFFKVNGESSNLGLGLYTVYNIVTLSLRGTIEWNSVEGMGTRFLIKLPLSLIQK